MSGEVLIGGTAALLLCLFLAPRFIEFLGNREFGQRIREEGPSGHHSKAGTPTMGGIIIFLAISIPFLVLTDWDWRAVGVFGVAVVCALLGFADDYVKIVKRRSLGLRGRTKMLVLLLVSVALWWVATQKAGVTTTVRIRAVDASIDLGIFFPVFVFLVVAGSTNAVNLTDGLDGLAAGSGAIVFGAYVFVGYWIFRHFGDYEINVGLDLAIVAAAMMSACAAFLWWNAPPARIFMGDTGSLAIGTGLAVLALSSSTVLLLPIIGGLFVIETLSVIGLVTSFRLFGKRPFHAPIHHDLEAREARARGIESDRIEPTVTIRLWILTAGCAVVGLGLFFREYIRNGGIG